MYIDELSSYNNVLLIWNRPDMNSWAESEHAVLA